MKKISHKHTICFTWNILSDFVDCFMWNIFSNTIVSRETKKKSNRNCIARGKMLCNSVAPKKKLCYKGDFFICANFRGNCLGVADNLGTIITVRFSSTSASFILPTRFFSIICAPSSDFEPASCLIALLDASNSSYCRNCPLEHIRLFCRQEWFLYSLTDHNMI